MKKTNTNFVDMLAIFWKAFLDVGAMERPPQKVKGWETFGAHLRWYDI